MKKFFNLPIIILMALASLFSTTAKATGHPTYSIPLQQEEDHKLTPENPKGRRSLSRPIMCIITPDGIKSTIDSADIIAYELWDKSEICLISTSDEAEFIDILYNLRGDLTLRIITEDYTYIGFLSI